MSTRAQDVRKFLRAAEQRMKAAEFLFEHDFWLDSIYLGGYAVECALKALILERTADNASAAMYGAITKGSVAHDFMFLKGKLVQAPIHCMIPKPVGRALRQVSSWTTKLRYEVGLIPEREARRFLDAAKGIREWVRRSIS